MGEDRLTQDDTIFDAKLLHSSSSKCSSSDCFIDRRFQLADNWFDEVLVRFRQVVDDLDPPTGTHKIKVAILDSGVDRNDCEIRGVLNLCPSVAASQVNDPDLPMVDYPISEQNCRGFPESLSPLNDGYGHGTHCATVLLRTASAAHVQLYIARIVDDNGKIDSRDNHNSIVEVPPFSNIF